MIYKVQKFLSGGIIAAAYFVIRSYFWNWGIKDNLLMSGYTVKDALAECLINGYFSTQEVILIGTLCMLFYVEYSVSKDEATGILRYGSRDRFVVKKLREIFLAAFLFCMIRVLVGIGFLWMEFNKGEIFTKGMLNFAFWFLVISFLYSARCSIIYMIIKDCTHKKVFAIIVIMIMQTTLYYIYIDQWLYPLLQKEINWVPFCDLDAPSAVFAGIVENSENIIVAFRQMCLTLMIAIVWTMVWKKKDVMQIEK